MNIADIFNQAHVTPIFRNPPYMAADAKPAVNPIPPEVLFAREFVNEHQVMARPVACHGDDCGFIKPDTMPGQDFAVGAAYDLIYGYFMQAAQKMCMPSPLDDDEFDDEDTEEFDEPLKQ